MALCYAISMAQFVLCLLVLVVAAQKPVAGQLGAEGGAKPDGASPPSEEAHAGDRVRERIGLVVEKERQRVIREALNAEFEVADKNEDGRLDPEEFATYLLVEDKYDPFRAAPSKRVAKASSQTKAPAAAAVNPVVDAATAAKGNAASLEEFDDSGVSLSFWPSCFNSILMIIVTELGDKTFFIAALMAMKNSRLIVYVGAVGALAIMTILSSVIGSALPALLPKVYTHYGAVLLFIFFGVKMLQEAREMFLSPPTSNEELEEAEEEISAYAKPGKDDGSNLERGTHRAKTTSKYEQDLHVLMQAFMMTFLAEWGDRSQIATIALATSKNPYGVTLGAVVGHAICTGLAVVGGRMLATKISEAQVALAGGLLFCIFALHSLVVGPDA